MSATMIPRPEQLVDIASHVAAVKLAMDGAFDERIAALKGATAKLEEAQAIATTIEQAKKIKDDADAYAATALGKARDALDRAQIANDKAASREVTVSAREQAVAARESTANARQDAQDRREEAILSAQSATDKSLAARENALKNGEADYTSKVKKLAADQAAFNQRLDALRISA